MKQLIDEFAGSGAVKGMLGAAAAASSCNLDKAQQEVDLKTYELLKHEIEFDTQAFTVYLANSASHKSAVAHQQNLWQRKLLDEARAAADAFLDQHVTCPSAERKQRPAHFLAAAKCVLQQLKVTAFIWEQSKDGQDPGMVGITAYLESQQSRMKRAQIDKIVLWT